MLKTLEIIKPKVQNLQLELADVDRGFLVKEIQGLSPVPATLVSSGIANRDGAYYQTARRETRNIVLTVEFLPDLDAGLSVKALRDQLARYLMPKTKSKLRFLDSEGPTLEIDVHIESFESGYFSSAPDAVISMIAFDPDFHQVDVETFTQQTTSTANTAPLQYDGSVETGVTFGLLANRNIDGFTIHLETASGTFQTLDYVGEILSGDYITIDSSERICTRIRGGEEISALNGVSPYASWPVLEPGLNRVRVFVTGASMGWTMVYNNKFGSL